MSGDGLKRGARDGTIGWLAERLYESEGGGWDTIEAYLDKIVDRRNFAAHAVLTAEDGESTTDSILAESRDASIQYRNYDPPALWGAPYSVFRIDVTRGRQGDLMHHTGDEIVRPISGHLNFDFYFARPGGGPKIVEHHSVDRHCLFRINPQIPHRVWVEQGEQSSAWLVVRDRSNLPAAVAAPRTGEGEGYRPPEMAHFSLDEMDTFAKYAMRAWGLIDHIRAYRRGAEWTSAQLARRCGLDKAQMSRMENGLGNTGILPLLKVLRVLRVPLRQLVQNSAWYCSPHSLITSPPESAEPDIEAEELTLPDKALPSPLKQWSLPHHLHPYHVNLEEGASQTLNFTLTRLRFLTVIPFDGEVVVEVTSETSDSVALELVRVGDVAHFRSVQQIKLQALTPLDVMIVGCSISAAR